MMTNVFIVIFALGLFTAIVLALIALKVVIMAVKRIITAYVNLIRRIGQIIFKKA